MPANLALAEPMSDSDPAYDARLANECERWLRELPDDFLLCYRNHHFAKLRVRNGKLPRGMSAKPIPEIRGHFQITQRCTDCGIKRLYTCTAYDIFAPQRSYDYDWPDGYNMPKGGASYITWSMILGERNRRFGEALIKLAA